ncbi:MAG: hypothetical protein RLZZ119_720, partial [Pseudomonadota bacterium]
IIIFNQYYYDLLTKIRTIAKKHKEHSSTAAKVVEVVKEHYKEFDKSSGDYVSFLNVTFVARNLPVHTQTITTGR